MSARTVRVSLLPPHFHLRRPPGGMTGYSGADRAALRADAHITAGRILDRRQHVAHLARRNPLGVDALKPLQPVRPPRALVLDRALHPLGDGSGSDVVVGPVLVLAACRRIDDAGDM